MIEQSKVSGVAAAYFGTQQGPGQVVSTSVNPVVKIYVRMGDERKEDERIISFRIPVGIDPMELLENDFAIDGNTAMFTIAPLPGGDGYDCPFNLMCGTTMTGSLRATQRTLVDYLREKGFEPQFA